MNKSEWWLVAIFCLLPVLGPSRHGRTRGGQGLTQRFSARSCGIGDISTSVTVPSARAALRVAQHAAIRRESLRLS